jgi:hypothetical protein
MTTRPVNDVIEWASDENYATGTYTGTPTQVVPSTGRFEQGFLADTVVPAQHVNYVLGNHSKWIGYLQNVQHLNWENHKRLKEASGAELAGDSVASICETTFSTFVVVKLATGFVRILRTRRGQEWDDNMGTTGFGSNTDRIKFVSSGSIMIGIGSGASLGNNTTRTIDDGRTFANVACHAGAGGYDDICYDGLNFYATPFNALSNKVGKSSTGGSWAAVTGSVPAGSHVWTGLGLCKIRCGATGNLVVWRYGGDSGAVNLNHVLYSTDGGATWTESSAIAGCTEQYDLQYSSAHEKFFLLCDAGLFSSPTGSVWTLINSTVTRSVYSSMAIQGGLILISNMSNTASDVLNFLNWSTDGGVSFSADYFDTVFGDQRVKTLVVSGNGKFWLYYEGDDAGTSKWLYSSAKL